MKRAELLGIREEMEESLTTEVLLYEMVLALTTEALEHILGFINDMHDLDLF